MDVLTELFSEITALTDEAALAMKNWQEYDPYAQQHIALNDLTKMQVFGEVSPSTFAVRLLSRRYFEKQHDLLKVASNITLEEDAVRMRQREALMKIQKLLDDLFRVLVEREVPEASEYCPWEVHPSGRVYARLGAENKDKRFVDYFSGKTQGTAIVL